MKITIDPEHYESLQSRVLEELIRSIRDGLREAGVADDQALYEATGNIAFSVAAIVDGSRVMDLDGAPVVPVLAFAKERDGDELIGAEAGSWLHECVFGCVDELFESEGED